MNNLSEMNDLLVRVTALRRELHNIPEPAFYEQKTMERLKRYLAENTDLSVVDRGNWFYAYYRAEKAEKTIAFRADFDAVCGKDGQVGHFCGHDGHSSILAGFAEIISRVKPDMNVVLIFQPAEEIGEGAKICRDILEEKNVSEIYGFHNIPGFERGTVLLLDKTFACASTGMEITVTGTPSHAAYPEAGRNPSEIIAGLIMNMDQYRSLSERDHKGLVLVTVIGAEIGSDSYGVSASKGILRLTVRAEYEDDFRRLIQCIEADAATMAEKSGMKCSVRLIETFPATENDTSSVRKVEKAAEEKGLKTICVKEPFRWSEDFGYYLQKIPGAFFGIGDGVTWPQLHTENYEFPDEIIKTVLELYRGLSES